MMIQCVTVASFLRNKFSSHVYYLPVAMLATPHGEDGLVWQLFEAEGHFHDRESRAILTAYMQAQSSSMPYLHDATEGDPVDLVAYCEACKQQGVDSGLPGSPAPSIDDPIRKGP